MGDVEQVCDRVGMLVNGKLHREGALSDLLTRETIRVDVLTRGVSDTVVQELTPSAQLVYEADDGLCFSFATQDDADEAARKIYSTGGSIVNLHPISESLEEYFVRQQETEETAS